MAVYSVVVPLESQPSLYMVLITRIDLVGNSIYIKRSLHIPVVVAPVPGVNLRIKRSHGTPDVTLIPRHEVGRPREDFDECFVYDAFYVAQCA